MKNVFKITSLLLICLFLASAFTACGGNVTISIGTPPASLPLSSTSTPIDNTTLTDTKGTLTQDPAPSLPPPGTTEIVIPETYKPQSVDDAIADKRFAGVTIRFITTGDDYIAVRSICIDKSLEDFDPNYSVNVAVDKRNQMVEEALGVKIEIVNTMTQGGLSDYICLYFNSPMMNADIFSVHEYYDLMGAYGTYVTQMTNVTKDHFADFNYLASIGECYLDIDAPYWDKEAYDTISRYNQAYWITGDLSQKWLSTPSVSFINARIWEENSDKIKEKTGYDNIYELVDSGKWTIETVTEILDIVSENGTAGLVAYNQAKWTEYQRNNPTAEALFAGCNMSFTVENDDDTIPSFVKTSTSIKTFMNTVYPLYTHSTNRIINYNSYLDGPFGEVKQIVGEFAKGDSFITFSELGDGEYLKNNMKDDYYIVPMPKMNDNQSSYATMTGKNTNHFGIPSACPNPGAATATLELLGKYSYSTVTPAYYGEFLKDGYKTENKDSASRMIDLIRDSLYCDFITIWNNKIKDYSPLDLIHEYTGTKSLAIQYTAKLKSWQNWLINLEEEYLINGPKRN